MPRQNSNLSLSLSSRADDAALAGWLDGARQPDSMALMWRLSLSYTRANALLAELSERRHLFAVLGVLDQSGVQLYLWQHRLMPGLQHRLLTYDLWATLVDGPQIGGGSVWAYGRALVRLVAARVRVTDARFLSARER